MEGEDAVDSNTDVEDVGLSADTHDTAEPPEEYWFTPEDEEAALNRYELAMHHALEAYKADLRDIQQAVFNRRWVP